jgi:hypothetical protein
MILAPARTAGQAGQGRAAALAWPAASSGVPVAPSVERKNSARMKCRVLAVSWTTFKAALRGPATRPRAGVPGDRGPGAAWSRGGAGEGGLGPPGVEGGGDQDQGVRAGSQSLAQGLGLLHGAHVAVSEEAHGRIRHAFLVQDLAVVLLLGPEGQAQVHQGLGRIEFRPSHPDRRGQTAVVEFGCVYGPQGGAVEGHDGLGRAQFVATTSQRGAQTRAASPRAASARAIAPVTASRPGSASFRTLR